MAQLSSGVVGAAGSVEDVLSAIRAETREDQVARLRDLRVTPEGLLATPAGYLLLEEEGLRQLAGWCGVRHLGASLPDLWRQNGAREPLGPKVLDDLLRTGDQEREVLLRSRSATANGGARGLYSARSSRYNRELTSERVLGQAVELLRDLGGADAGSLRVTYDGRMVRATIRTDRRAEGKARMGDVFVGGAGVSTADDGSASASVEAYLFRLICENGAREKLAGGKARRRHVGTTADLSGLRTDLQRALNQANGMADAFAKAREVDVFERYRTVHGTEPTRRAVVEASLRANPLAVPGVDRDRIVEDVTASWDHNAAGPLRSEGETLTSQADLVNAFTLASWWRAPSWPGMSRWTAKEAVEEHAGKLLRVRVAQLI